MQLAVTTLLDEYYAVRKHTTHLCNPLTPEDMLPQAAIFVSPVKWHLAHTTWFFEQFILQDHLPEYKAFDSRFHFLFNSYYNSLGERIGRDQRGLMTRPSMQEVWDYRAHVDEAMAQLLKKGVHPAAEKLLQIGLQHEQQHQELILMDLKYLFSQNPTHPVYDADACLVDDLQPGNDWIPIAEGDYFIGAEGDGFHFDNEFGRHQVHLQDFSIASALVTNADFVSFIEAGGYQDHRLWHDEGWAWVNQNQVEHPLYWKKEKGQWQQFTLAGMRELAPEAALCHVSHYEAFAFAAWTGARLPTEFEWEAAANRFDWNQRWEHTSSAYMPYPGYRKPEGAVGEYNGKFMINQMVLRGASNATPKGHSRPTYRNFFHPNMQWHFSGIRLAKDGQ